MNKKGKQKSFWRWIYRKSTEALTGCIFNLHHELAKRNLKAALKKNATSPTMESIIAFNIPFQTAVWTAPTPYFKISFTGSLILSFFIILHIYYREEVSK